jgi:hypothetical protein
MVGNKQIFAGTVRALGAVSVKMFRRSTLRMWLLASGLAALTTACSSGAGSTPTVPATQSLAASVVGLNAGTSFGLQDNAGDKFTVSSAGTITLKTTLLAGAAYTLTVTTQPSGEFCNIQNASGTIGSTSSGAITIGCAKVLAGGSGPIPTTGGSVTTPAADLTIPVAASLQPQNVTITTMAPPAGIPSLFTPIGAAVDVAIDQPAELNAPLLVTLRYDASIVSDESNLLVIHYNSTTNLYEPVTIVSQDTTNHAFTIATRVFSPFQVVSFDPTLVPASHMVTNFSVANNGWNIDNIGSYFVTGGNCLGMSAYDIWYFENQTDGLYGHFSASGAPSIAQIVATRAQIAQSNYWSQLSSQTENSLLSPAQIGKWMKALLAAFDKPLILTLQRQLRSGPSHASVLYGYDASGFTFYDVNYMNAQQSLTFDGTSFGTYGAPNDYGPFTTFGFLAGQSVGRTQDFGQLTSDANSGFIYSQHISVTTPADFTTPITSPPINIVGTLAAGLDPAAVLIGFFPPQSYPDLNPQQLATAPGQFTYQDSVPMLGDNTIVLLAGVIEGNQSTNWYPSSDTYIFELNYTVDGLLIPVNPPLVVGQTQVFTMTVSGVPPAGAIYRWTVTGAGSISASTTTTNQVTFTAANTAGPATLSVAIVDQQGNTLSTASEALTVNASNGCFDGVASILQPGSTYSLTQTGTTGGLTSTIQTNYVAKGVVPYADAPFTSTAYEQDSTVISQYPTLPSSNQTSVEMDYDAPPTAANPTSWVAYGSSQTITDASGDSSVVQGTFSTPVAEWMLMAVPVGSSTTLTYAGTGTSTNGTTPHSGAFNYTETWTLLGTPTITVPAGTFKTCNFKVTSTLQSDTTLVYTHWWLYGNGISIQEMQTDSSTGAVYNNTQATSLSINGAPYTGP